MFEYQQPVTIRVWFANGKSKTFDKIVCTDNKLNSCLLVRDNGRSIMLNWQNINFIEEE